jgi:P27 family predicted phage terminase small subunit
VRALDALEGVDRAIVDKWVLAENRLVVVEQTIDETGYLTSGSMDQVTLNPLWRARKDLQDEIRRYWEVLGLTPRDRARLGIDLIRQQSDAASWNERLSRISKGETQESDKVRRAFQGRRKP